MVRQLEPVALLPDPAVCLPLFPLFRGSIGPLWACHVLAEACEAARTSEPLRALEKQLPTLEDAPARCSHTDRQLCCAHLFFPLHGLVLPPRILCSCLSPCLSSLDLAFL